MALYLLNVFRREIIFLVESELDKVTLAKVVAETIIRCPGPVKDAISYLEQKGVLRVVSFEEVPVPVSADYLYAVWNNNDKQQKQLFEFIKERDGREH
ncbi:hypothetical protein [Thermococcus sp. 21S7]|uniref:hypothetical protein n=1 Tax=Thermococcus sp. 21S7 TaxID=1638221 RepID=UPI00143A1A06|nr:hypothetical protein [Thermococcus sp. 21S7]NJE60449.1 hypothetical protein [Thermococcus sp. 21S7]